MVLHHRPTLAAALVGGALLAAATSLAPAAQAVTPAQPGLYGSADPTYDAAFRQSLALLAHAAAGSDAPAAAVDWLVGQQCADGGYQAFRASTSQPCTASDPVNYTGEDTNSTALASLALRASGHAAAADRAVAWLEAARSADGGFPYFVGGGSDANSTADVLLALNGAGAGAGSTGPARAFLETLQLGCDGAPEDGGFAFQDYGSGLVANDAATVQAVVALSGSGLPVEPAASTSDAPRATCPVPVPAPAAIAAPDLGAGYVARVLDGYAGAIPQLDYSTGSRTPGTVAAGDTAWAVLGLTATGLGSAQRTAALATVTTAASAASADDDPGLLALAALATHAAGGSGSDVAGYVARIDATMRAAASPTPSATETATPAPTASGTTGSSAEPTAAASTTQSGAELPPTGSTPLTPALVGAGALMLAVGLSLVLGVRRRGTHA